jgi:hypothetical protein
MNRATQIIKAASDAVAHINDPLQRLADQVGRLQGEIRRLLPAATDDGLPRGSFCCEAEIDGLGDCIVHYDYSPGRPGRNYMPNGDPGYPDDPAELMVTVVQIAGCEFDYDVFSADVQERLTAAADRDVEQREDSEMEAWAADRELTK